MGKNSVPIIEWGYYANLFNPFFQHGVCWMWDALRICFNASREERDLAVDRIRNMTAEQFINSFYDFERNKQKETPNG